MSVYVVDASVATKWFFKEDHREAALRLLGAGDQLHAPDFFLLEMDNVLCKYIRRGGISVSDSDDIRAALQTSDIGYHPFGSLRDRAYEIASATGCSVYDCLYAALAVTLGTRMVTADRRFYDRLAKSPLAEHVLWVEDIGGEEGCLSHKEAGRRDAKGRRRRRR